jgi:hypothetical protein
MNRIEKEKQIISNLKFCISCEISKPINMFSINNTTWDSVLYQCKQCRREYERSKWVMSDKTKKFRLNQEMQVMLGMKTCTCCGQPKPLNMFHNNRDKWDGLVDACKPCNRLKVNKWRKDFPEKAKNADIKKNYGITLSDKLNMLESQGRVCAACGTDQPGGKYNEWHIDHNHATGKVRELLCADCNMALGVVRESIPRLEGLVRYMNKHTQAAVVYS